MRKFIVAAAMAIGLIAVWAAILPLTAQPASKDTAADLATVSKALVLETSGDPSNEASERVCHADPQVLASLRHQD